MKLTDFNIIGQGGHANVYAHKGDDNHDRVIRVALSNDPHSIFVDAAMRSRNPYLPKFFSKTATTHEHHVTMERLYPFADYRIATHEIIQSQLRRWFIASVARELLDEINLDISEYGEENADKMAGAQVARVFGDVMDGTLPLSVIADEQLQAAIVLVQKVLRDNPNLAHDMYWFNMMWRMTGSMPHLVITDPVTKT